MSIQDWSDNVLLGELQDDPALSDDLTALVEQVRESTDRDLVLDFTNVGYVNSSNIAKLLKLRKIVTLSNRRKMVLCGINSHVWGVFLITGLEKLFEFADNVSLALAAVQLNNDAGELDA